MRDRKAATQAAEDAMRTIRREIETERGLVFITFTHNQFEVKPAGYFDPMSDKRDADGGVPVPIRIDLPVPTATPVDAVSAFVSAIIRDGYDFQKITYHPGP
jgi:hypothetical protein